MNIIKRIFISISRRKLNSLILLLVVFILANILLTTLSVNLSLISTKNNVLKEIPPIVKIDINYEKEIDDAKHSPPLNIEMINKLYRKNTDIIKSYDYETSIELEGNSNYKKVSLFEDDLEEEHSQIINISGTEQSLGNSTELKNVKCLSGQGFSKSDISNGNNKILISQQLADVNDWTVGDVVQFYYKSYSYEDSQGSKSSRDIIYEKEVNYEVSGILEYQAVENIIKDYGSNQKNATTNLTSEEKYLISKLSNAIITPNMANIKLQKEILMENTEQNVDNIEFNNFENNFLSPQFLLNDASDFDEFINSAKSIYGGDNYIFTSSSDVYEVTAQPLNSIAELINTIFLITAFASITIITIVLGIFINLRQKEIGILLALGERKFRIIYQLLSETIVIALVGATLAVFTSLIFSNILANDTIDNLSSEISFSEDFTSDMHTFEMQSSLNLSPDFIANQYQGGYNIEILGVFYMILIIIIILSNCTSIIYLMRLNPKKILM